MQIRVNTNALEPNYRPGDICVIATDTDAEASDDVLVKDAEGTFAILLAPAVLDPSATFVGVVIERRRRLR